MGYGLVDAYAAVAHLFKINGPSLLCRSSDIFSVTNLPSGFSWGTSSNLTILSTSGNSATIQATNTLYTSGSLGWVCVKNANGVEINRKEVWIGYPDVQIDGPDYAGSYGRYSAIYNPLSNPSLNWSVYVPWPNTYSLYNYSNYLDVYFNHNATYQVILNACNVCGCGPQETKDVYASPGRSPSPFSIYPNPVDKILSVDIDQQVILAKYAAAGKTAITPTCEISLFSLMGVQVYKTATNGNKVQIDVSNLPDGNYFVHLFDGISAFPEVMQIIVKH